MQWLDYLLMGVVALALGKAVHTCVKLRKQGKSGCGGNCAACSQSCANRK